MDYSQHRNSQSQQPKIKILHTVQKNLIYLGIGLNPAIKLQTSNGKILINFLILTTAVVWMLLYILNNAETFTEYTQSIYLSSSFILMILALIITIFNSTKLYKIINHCECLINIRKYKFLFLFQRLIQVLLFFLKTF